MARITVVKITVILKLYCNYINKKEEDMNIQIELISESDLADESFNIVIDG